MLLDYGMTRIMVRVLGIVLNSALKFAPDSYPFEEHRGNFNIPSAGWKSNGWILKEFISPVSGCKHRYYFHSASVENAPVFLFLHGLFLDGRNFINVSELADTWTLIAYDFPEMSDAYRGDMNDFKYLLDDFLDCLNITRFFLCGVSFGGGVGLRYAASHPTKVVALLLVSTFVMNSDPSDRLKSREMSKFIFNNSDSKLYWFVEKLFKIAFRGTHNPMNKLSGIVYLKRMSWYRQALRSLSTFDGSEESSLISCPVIGIHGTADRTISLKKALSIKKCIPHAKFEMVENGTHAMIYLQGSELVRIIRAFCTSLVLEKNHSS